MKATSNRLLGQLMKSAGKGHQRTCSSPIGFPIGNDIHRESTYVHTAPRLSDSDSSNEHPPQRILMNNNLPTDNPSSDVRERRNIHRNFHSCFCFQRYQFDKNCSPLTLNSSGGFSTSAMSSLSHDKITPSQRPSNGSVFLPNDEDLSSRSSRSASYSCDQNPSSFEDPLSPVFQTEHFPFSKPTMQNLISNSSSSSSSSQQYSPAIVRTAPLHISIHSSTPPVPHLKQSVSSFSPPTNNTDDHQLFFTGRSPSPPHQIESTNHSSKPVSTSSSATFHRQQYALSKNQPKQ